MTPTPELIAELLPCPFCGGTNIQLSNGETFRWRYVGCAECGAQIEFRSDNRFEPTDETWKDAAETWNRRQSLSRERGDALEEAAVAAWKAGMEQHTAHKGLPHDCREIGSLCAQAIRALAKERA